MGASIFTRSQRLSDESDFRKLTDDLIDRAASMRASDVHIEPAAGDCELLARVDGLLETIERVPADVGRGMVARLMVMAKLLTYRTDVPQEGRLIALSPALGRELEARVSVMPTTHGLRAALRLPAEISQPRALDELELPVAVRLGLEAFARRDDGMLLLTGPAGSGKTTTIYAFLQYLQAACPGQSIIALEDPVERDLSGVTQIEVRPFGELTYEKALRSLLRQDPQILMLGEIRDRETAHIAVQAALTGHRLIATFHAGTPGGAIARMLDMGIEPYQVAGSVFGIVAQRLLRRGACHRGYNGRVPIGEFVGMDQRLHDMILQRAGRALMTEAIEKRRGHQCLRDSARALIAEGVTDEAEMLRVLGAAAAAGDSRSLWDGEADQ